MISNHRAAIVNRRILARMDPDAVGNNIGAFAGFGEIDEENQDSDTGVDWGAVGTVLGNVGGGIVRSITGGQTNAPAQAAAVAAGVRPAPTRVTQQAAIAASSGTSGKLIVGALALGAGLLYFASRR